MLVNKPKSIDEDYTAIVIISVHGGLRVPCLPARISAAHEPEERAD